MYRNALFTDSVRLLSAIFNRVSQHPSYAQKHSIIDNSWLCSIIVNQVESALLVICASSSALGASKDCATRAIQGLAVHPYFAHLVKCNLWIAWPIRGLLHKARIRGLRRTILGLSQFNAKNSNIFEKHRQVHIRTLKKVNHFG